MYCSSGSSSCQSSKNCLRSSSFPWPHRRSRSMILHFLPKIKALSSYVSTWRLSKASNFAIVWHCWTVCSVINWWTRSKTRLFYIFMRTRVVQILIRRSSHTKCSSRGDRRKAKNNIYCRLSHFHRSTSRLHSRRRWNWGDGFLTVDLLLFYLFLCRPPIPLGIHVSHTTRTTDS